MAGRLGVCLSGGGLPGVAAHLGFLRGLTEAGISPQVTVGNSAGGIVTGALASGVPLEGMVSFTRGLCRWPERYALKEIESVLGILSPTDAPGLLTLQPAIADLLTHGTAKTVADWAQGYAVTATDLSDGSLVRIDRSFVVTRPEQPVWMHATGQALPLRFSLPVADAIQATSAFEGVLRGVRLEDGRLLGDGGLLDNVPTDAAFDLGADRVVVVDLDGDLPTLPPLLTTADLMRRTMQVALRSLTRDANPARGPVLRIMPSLPPAGLLQFSCFEACLAAGYQSAVTQRAQIEAFVAGGVAA